MTAVTIEDKTREVSAADILSLCMKKNINILTDPFTGRVSLRGKSKDVLRLRAILSASPDVEAALMLELSKSCPSLRDILIERACIAELATVENSAKFLVSRQETPKDII